MTTIHTAFKPFHPEVVFQSVTANVEVDITTGIGIHLVGLADNAIKEALLRTVTALQASGFRIPGKKIIINITPAVRYRSTPVDLAIALGIIIESGQLRLPFNTDDLTFIGELGLDGSIRPAGIENDCILRRELRNKDRSLIGAYMGDDYAPGNNGETGFFGFRTLDELLQFAGECWCNELQFKHA